MVNNPFQKTMQRYEKFTRYANSNPQITTFKKGIRQIATKKRRSLKMRPSFV